MAYGYAAFHFLYMIPRITSQYVLPYFRCHTFLLMIFDSYLPVAMSI